MKKKHKIILMIAAVILCAVLLVAAIRVFPLMQAARTLHRVMNAECVDFEVDVTLNPDRLSGEQRKLLAAVSWLLETEESTCMSWNIRGYRSGGQGYAEISCKGLEGNVTDVYFSEDETIVNVKMLYEALQKNFSGAHPILGVLLPDWKYSDYVLLEQIEEIFQVDIRSMYHLSPPRELSAGTVWQNLLILRGIERKKSADNRRQFETMWNSYQTTVTVGNIGQAPEISVEGTDGEDKQIIASYNAFISSGAEKQTVYPDSVMGQEEIRQFQDLWGTVKGIQGEFGKEQ